MVLLFSLLFLIFHARSVLSSCAHGTFLHPRAAGGIGELPNFDYGPVRGPTNWHSISRENILCAVGLQQSPINLNGRIPIEPVGFVRSSIPRQDILFENLGTTAEVVLNGTTLVRGAGEFRLKQFHFHTPSEHRILGQHFPVELHLVHTSVVTSSVSSPMFHAFPLPVRQLVFAASISASSLALFLLCQCSDMLEA
ncbi:carbonic anhydrase 2 [Coccidioides immitis RMSCC 3703]|uniref:Carbonic anhydrase n=1 Tax=Coccidioides immitis RMSCC 3703 TaxID=454286 RepID=A0A0J8QPU0_COCIT|nr:carbonic anhydrase 2 [Coccidioides immitis RMSCC 3703]